MITNFRKPLAASRLMHMQDCLRHGPMTVAQLAECIGISGPSARHYIAHLIAHKAIVFSHKTQKLEWYKFSTYYIADNEDNLDPIRSAPKIKPFIDMKALPREFFSHAIHQA